MYNKWTRQNIFSSPNMSICCQFPPPGGVTTHNELFKNTNNSFYLNNCYFPICKQRKHKSFLQIFYFIDLRCIIMKLSINIEKFFFCSFNILLIFFFVFYLFFFQISSIFYVCQNVIPDFTGPNHL